MEELTLHPTVRPVQMIADAIRDVSGRDELVLNVFGGCGSTLVAAEKTGRRGFLIELDPIYRDRILARWEAFAKGAAKRPVCGIPQVAEKIGGGRTSSSKEERMKAIVLDEAYRTIAIRDDDRNVTVPMAQAIIRSLAVNAAKG